MKDPRNEKLAKLLINHSVRAQKGEKVLIHVNNDATELVTELVKATYEAGAYPFVKLENRRVERSLLMGCTEEQLKIRQELELEEMKKMNCYIGFTALENQAALSDVPQGNLDLFARVARRDVTDYRINQTKWCVLRYPTAAMAQLSNMSEESFEDFFYNVCCLDYSKMSRAMDSLVALMEKTDKVRLTAKNTDITFSIKDIPVIKCDGECNIPDGEVYTAPVKNSINGTLSYNTPSVRDGFTFENIVLEFKNGKIVNATSNDTDKINQVFDTDEGARFVGEFAIGVNPFILEPMKETLFDEKIAGSFHFTPGNAYENADNGNRSAIHWDLVCIQRPEYGGGEMYFDDVLVRKDGLFVLPELECLNPENLK